MLHHWFRAFAPACLIALAAIASPAVTSPAAAKPVVEVAFVLDTTGSMSRLIEGAKRKIWSIATAIVEANADAEIRMGLVAYRDIGDEYVTRTFELTADIQDLYAKLLQLEARGGGDWPESVNEALQAGVEKLNWSSGPDTWRILFLVGDAPPHMDYAQDTKYPGVITTARKKDIIVNAVQAGGARDTERVWREIAQLGEGRYIAIPQDGGEIVVIETPYDDGIIELQKRINGTVLPYGPRAKKARVEEKQRQVAVAPASSATELASYLNKRIRTAGYAEAVTGDGDLVADVTAGRKALDAVPESDLPDTLRGMPAKERRAEIERRLAERKTLNERMAELVRKRDHHIREKHAARPAPASDSFDRVVAETLKAQINR
ncbi:MAG: VWA domain-containing protein [Pseudorhodoplanes sp.]|nr:hypothetical protein [Pseudorhodoplanes sp.]MBW7949515.1 VWA domain-containing protein [Pseudorhodoplanes sp.]GIK79908.1 MAG: hypothetical protein BroJett024_10130 [Alphaproteobacteria bacterium]